MKLSEKVAIVTGGGSGIGRATAILFAGEGAKVVVGDRDPAGGNGTVDSILSAGGKATFVQVDVTVASQVQSLAQQAVDKYGKVDTLFNNAGIELWASVTDTTELQWDTLIDINLKGIFLVAKYCIPEMKKAGGGAIVNTASSFAHVGGANQIAYCASKAGVLGMTRSMAIELASDNIRVNCIAPGWTDTPMPGLWLATQPDPVNARAEAQKDAPMGRWGKPEEIAKCVAFLVSDDASYVTGHSLSADGGLIIR